MRAAAAPLPEELLLDYAAGTTSPAIGLLMATHLSMSSESRAVFSMMQTLGGALLDDLDDEPLERISASSVLVAADAEEDRSDLAPPPGAMGFARTRPRDGMPETFEEDSLPAPLKLAEAEIGGDQRWRRLGFGVAATKLAVSTGRERAHLLWARGGTDIAAHRHVGREVVLVLKGSFWDNGIRYGAGDVALSEDGTVHSPHIDREEDCVCLAVTEAPVHFTGFSGFILNRICRF